jgi:hypothetical protein
VVYLRKNDISECIAWSEDADTFSVFGGEEETATFLDLFATALVLAIPRTYAHTEPDPAIKSYYVGKDGYHRHTLDIARITVPEEEPHPMFKRYGVGLRTKRSYLAILEDNVPRIPMKQTLCQAIESSVVLDKQIVPFEVILEATEKDDAKDVDDDEEGRHMEDMKDFLVPDEDEKEDENIPVEPEKFMQTRVDLFKFVEFIAEYLAASVANHTMNTHIRAIKKE